MSQAVQPGPRYRPRRLSFVCHPSHPLTLPMSLLPAPGHHHTHTHTHLSATFSFKKPIKRNRGDASEWNTHGLSVAVRLSRSPPCVPLSFTLYLSLAATTWASSEHVLSSHSPLTAARHHLALGRSREAGSGTHGLLHVSLTGASSKGAMSTPPT
ncbi:hypothetical protein E2C01_029937 [Portunus trituberculatus]|uniref:Uncharacterized protein n=1 Tax=Portunus trituberculatus TaxID=210409 RepID=A0A5B7ETD4_PORTR|nr:hypothetical protein [Portunus trituberculatus]